MLSRQSLKYLNFALQVKPIDNLLYVFFILNFQEHMYTQVPQTHYSSRQVDGFLELLMDA